MKYAIIGDIHSNLEALSVVLEDAKARDVTHYACVGDIVGYNADPLACLQLLYELPNLLCVRGNHDHYCSHEDSLTGFHPLAADVVAWTRRQLGDADVAFLRGLRFVLAAPHFTLVHSTLDTPEMWGYVFDKLEADANFAYQNSSLCFFGHTHVPLAFEKASDIQFGLYTKIKIKMGRKYFINVGSVGQPRDGDPRAAYATYEVKSKEVHLHRIPYDIESAQRKIIKAGLPERLAERLSLGR